MNEEQLWYSAFRLKENPFKFFEANLESFMDGIPVLSCPMEAKVKSFIAGKVSVVIQGPRGCGKSVLISMMEPEENIYRIVTPKSIHDIYHEIFIHTDYKFVEDAVSNLWAPRGHEIKSWDAKTENCVICPKRCHMPIKRGVVSEYCFHLRFVKGPCLAKEMIVMQMFQPMREFLMENIFLIDVPDNLDREGLRKLVELTNAILESANTLILFATPQQGSFLKKTDTFRRLPFVDFALPDKKFFIDLFKQRIDGFREGEVPYPFKDEIIEKLAELSDHVPRDFIQLCNLVIVEMWLQGLSEPCGLDIIDKIDIGDIEKSEASEKDIVHEILEPYKGQWIKLEILCQELEPQMGRLTERKASSILKDLGFTLRRVKAGKTEALITPYILEKHTEK